MPMAMAPNTVGSWFPTGYYGHFRNKARCDFPCEYRQLARPQPPEKFLKRSMNPCSKHVFSKHDNRNSFMTDALYFEQGLGRRKSELRRNAFNQDFYTWMPLKQEIEHSRPEESTYQLDFTKSGRSSAATGSKVSQILTRRPATSFESVPITTYRYCHGEGGPNRVEMGRASQRALELTVYDRKNRALTAKPACRDTVASCLSWHRPKAPKATEVTDFNSLQNYQHVPSPPQTSPPALNQAPPASLPPAPSLPPPPSPPAPVI